FDNLTELSAFWWGALTYGLAFAGAGLGIAAGLAFLYLLANRFPRPTTTFALCLGGALAGGALVIGRWRFQRDILGKHAPTLSQNTVILLAALAVGAMVAVAMAVILWRARGGRVKGTAAGGVAFVALVLAGACASMAARPVPAGPGPAGAGSPATGPNLILIVADALRADYLSLYNADAAAKTPNLEALRADGVLFESHFSQASWTKPAFATIFSGLYPGSHTATSQVAALPGEVETFPEVLEAGGYFTKAFANNPNITATYNFHQGFTDYVDLKPDLCFGASESGSRLTIYEILRRLPKFLPWKKMAVTDFYQPADVVTARALDWLRSREDEGPFFLFLHYMEPHDPFMDWEHPGVGYARRDMGDPDADKFLEPMRKAYTLELEHMDQYLGVLFAGLRELGIYDDAVVVFTADHGEEFYDHGGWWHGKTLYDEVVHVPMVVKLPRKAGAQGQTGELARHIDVGPTLLYLAGLNQPESMTGKPLVSAAGEAAATGTNYVYAENDFEGNVLEAVRTQKTKLIRANADNPRGLAEVEFYDLEADGGSEGENRAGQGDVREGALSKLLDDMKGHIREQAAEPQLLEGPTGELKEQLDALGYL
ncbi:MAG: sulfatase, partial [Candidatus Hydrogenedentes bacterium]|nr:sulfatase [Candidatus Hydrogenedentota bacterium]